MKAHLILQCIPGIGIKRFAALTAHFGSPDAVLHASEPELSSLPQPIRTAIRDIQQQADKHPIVRDVNQQLEQLAQAAVHVLSTDCPQYPPLLKEIAYPPPVIYVKGHVSLLNSTQLGIVGGRKASSSALGMTRQWASLFSQAGLTVTSGLALGIDGAAHQGVLDVRGQTIAVLAHGMDIVYPRQHQAMAQAILDQGGALVCEFPLGVAPKREHFPRRNRIISGLSHGVLVIEAAQKSGSLITANYAVEQNREVYAVPGSIHDLKVSGCNALIKQGAQLVDDPNDILSNMHAMPKAVSSNELPIKTSHAQKSGKCSQAQPPSATDSLLATMPYDFTHLDELLPIMDVPLHQLNALLIQWQLAKQIEESSGCYRRIANE